MDVHASGYFGFSWSAEGFLYQRTLEGDMIGLFSQDRQNYELVGFYILSRGN